MGSLPVGHCDNGDLDAEPTHALQHPSSAQDLVIRMRCNDHKTTWSGDLQRWQGSEPLRAEPRTLVGARVILVND